MNSINKELHYNDGTSSIIEISSNDNRQVKLNNNYVIANKKVETNRFKDSILGSDIGIGSKGFASITIFASLISVVSFILMILSFRI